MKRCWFGLILLGVLLAVSAASSLVMTRVHSQVEEDLDRAAEFSQAGQWEEADQCFLRAKRTWRSWERLRACLADHNPVEEADAAFAAAEVYLYTRQDTAFAAACRSLARQTAAVGQAHELTWWNIL